MGDDPSIVADDRRARWETSAFMFTVAGGAGERRCCCFRCDVGCWLGMMMMDVCGCGVASLRCCFSPSLLFDLFLGNWREQIFRGAS